MNEANIRAEIQKAIQDLGGYYYHAPDVNVKEARSRPDIFVAAFRTVVIEVKKVTTWEYEKGDFKGALTGQFDLRDIRKGQRHLMDSLVEAQLPGYFAIGNVSKDRRIVERNILVIPWSRWSEYEWSLGDEKFAYWHDILQNFDDSFGMDRIEGQFKFPRTHPTYHQCTGQFKWLEKPTSRRFEEEEKK